MRVLYFSRRYTPHDHRFLTAMRDLGAAAHFLRLEPAGGGETRPLPEGVQEQGWRSQARGTEDLLRVIDRARPDLIHAGPIQACAARVARAGFQPLVSMSWGSDLLLEARGGAGEREARRALRGSAALLCDCRAVEAAARALGMPAERIVVFPWGVDLQHFAPGPDAGLRRHFGWEQAFVVLSARSWEPVYGLDVLAAGFGRAARRNASLRMLMLGDGSQRQAVLAGLDRAGALERVRVLGQIGLEALPGAYRAADLYVSASRSDGSSVSLLEAMACGLPALVSDIPANREWVRPGESGWWFESENAGALAERLLEAAADCERLQRFGAAARATAERRADWRRGVEWMAEAYRRARTGEAVRA